MGFYDSVPLFSATIDYVAKDYLLNSAGDPIIYRGLPVRKNDHLIIEHDNGFLIRSCGETIHLEKTENNWPIMDELVKEDMSWWERFKKRFEK